MSNSISSQAGFIAAPASTTARASALMTAGSLGKWLVVFGTTFNIILCFFSTRGWIHINNAMIAGIELAIMGIGLYTVRNNATWSAISIMGLICAYLIGVKMINPGASLKIIHDIGICYIFYQLGRMGSQRYANSAMWLTMWVVLAIGMFELLATNAFGQMFNIWQYYVQKGVISAGTINYGNSTFFRSGDRAGSATRTFFPGLLGPHRVSSVFLEPVSLGNYAAVVFAYCVSVSKNRPGQRHILLYAASLFCVVLGDSRFAFGCCALMAIMRFMPFRRNAWLSFLLPVCIATALLVIGSLNERPGIEPAIVTDDLKGRLLFSARLLDYWNLSQWFAFAPSQVYTADTGYAYIVNALGLPLSLILLGIFAFHRCVTPEAGLMKTMIAVYFAASLCIGAGAFTIKTSALLWLAYGALDIAPKVRKAGRTWRKPEDMSFATNRG
ncbi:polysaccharide polymerase [Kozakia baliensis]|uniref:polysaccharide polymerase n=1 Tax=Kozakia baliensis TaxID=153496 RepID=UPI001873864E|nr:polysaccharide polymerase [Kozakia baliensis]